MIHKPKKMLACGKVWYYQEFTADSLCDDFGFNLYDSNGDFVKEFISYDEMTHWIEKVKLLEVALTPREIGLVRVLCMLGIYNFMQGAQEPYCPNEHDKNILQDILAKVVNADMKGRLE